MHSREAAASPPRATVLTRPWVVQVTRDEAPLNDRAAGSTALRRPAMNTIELWLWRVTDPGLLFAPARPSEAHHARNNQGEGVWFGNGTDRAADRQVVHVEAATHDRNVTAELEAQRDNLTIEGGQVEHCCSTGQCAVRIESNLTEFCPVDVTLVFVEHARDLGEQTRWRADRAQGRKDVEAVEMVFELGSVVKLHGGPAYAAEIRDQLVVRVFVIRVDALMPHRPSPIVQWRVRVVDRERSARALVAASAPLKFC